jgi:hypothetical protein
MGRKLPLVQTNPLSFKMPARWLAVRRTACTNLTLAMRLSTVVSHPVIKDPDDTSVSTSKRRSIHCLKDMRSLDTRNKAGEKIDGICDLKRGVQERLTGTCTPHCKQNPTNSWRLLQQSKTARLTDASSVWQKAQQKREVFALDRGGRRLCSPWQSRHWHISGHLRHS